jgi:ubiquinone/menaquinone biosynthesis C-methylase UbiE
MKYSHYITDGDSLELEIVIKAFGLRSLHYGLWVEGQPLTIDELSKAQENYTFKLFSLFPKEAITVLDIGAGIGDNAIYMAEKDLKVTSVSPSPSHEKFFNENILNKHDNISFIKSKYQDLEIDNTFDVVLMSESSNYFPMGQGLDQTLRFLKKGGYLVIGSMFRKDHRTTFEEQHVYQSFLDQANRKGLTLVEDHDVTKQVVPTLELIHSIYKYIPPLTEVLSDFYQKTFSRKNWLISKLIKALFHKELEYAKELILDVGYRRNDPIQFLEFVTYRLLAFQKI